MAKKTRRVEARSKKKWYPIVAPKMFLEQTIGETLAYSPQELIGKTVRSNLMVFTGDPKKQSVNISFKVKQIKDNRGYTECMGYYLSPASIRRSVRRNRERIDESYTLNTSDGKRIQLKPFVLTRFNANRSLTNALRKALFQQMQQIIPKTSFENLIRDLVANKFQTRIKDYLRKIYPLTTFEVRMIKIVGQSGVQVVEPKKEVETAEPTEQPKAEPAEKPEAKKIAEPKEDKGAAEAAGVS